MWGWIRCDTQTADEEHWILITLVEELVKCTELRRRKTIFSLEAADVEVWFTNGSAARLRRQAGKPDRA